MGTQVLGTQAEFDRWNGPPLAVVVRGLADDHQIRGDPDVLFREYVSKVESAYVDSTLTDGAVRLLDWIESQDIMAAVVTSAPRRLALPLLEARGIGRRLPVLICGDDTPRGKPHPDGFLAALRWFGIAPARAIIVEDSPSGVTAAVAAGVRCLGVGCRKRELLDAGAVAGLSDLDEVREVLSGLLHGPGRVVVASSIRIRSIGPVRPLGDDIEERIATEWQGALVERPTMTDDEIVAVGAWRLARDVLDVEVSLTHYRTYVAQRRGVPVGIVPLGVSGVVRLDSGGLVLGKRSQDVTQYAGFWEFIPSGGVSRKRMADDGVVDATGQLLEELREELGISTDRVRRVLPLGLIEDVADRVIDLAYAIDLSATVEELQRGILQRGEYVEVQVLCASEIEKLLSTGRSTIAPTVMPLLRLLRVKAPA
jgi:beta-phosphoglucomutase-like phosphatase (HAD superfamily)